MSDQSSGAAPAEGERMDNAHSLAVPQVGLLGRSGPQRPGALGRIAILTRLEMAESLRSRWLLFAAISYGLGLGAFIWLGLRESSVLGFTGLSRVVLGVCNAMVVILPLVALVATCQAVTRARATGHLELLLTQPVRRTEWFTSLLVARAFTLIAPLAVLLVLLGVAQLWNTDADPQLAPMSLHALAVSGSLLVAFLGLGSLVSAAAKTAERAVVMALLLWLATAALHDFALIGVLLQWRVSPQIVFGLAAVNPIEAARLAVLSSIDPELSVLGPVGFWIANQLGPVATYTFGLLYPVVVGVAAALLAARLVNRRDAVG